MSRVRLIPIRQLWFVHGKFQKMSFFFSSSPHKTEDTKTFHPAGPQLGLSTPHSYKMVFLVHQSPTASWKHHPRLSLFGFFFTEAARLKITRYCIYRQNKWVFFYLDERFKMQLNVGKIGRFLFFRQNTHLANHFLFMLNFLSKEYLKTVFCYGSAARLWLSGSNAFQYCGGGNFNF